MMSLDKKKIYGLMLVILGSTISIAQEINVSLGGHLIVNSQSYTNYKATGALGYNAGMGYRYYLSPQWSIGSEVSYQRYNHKFKELEPKGSWSATDTEENNYEFRYKSRNRKEQINYHIIQIPLTIQYETKGLVKWYVQTGFGIGLIVGTAQSKITMNDLTTSGYYAQWDAVLNGPNFMGFGDFKQINQKNDLALNTRYSWIVESGIKQELSDSQSLYIGGYLDLGLNNLSRDSNYVSKNPISIKNDYDNSIDLHSYWTQEENRLEKFKNYQIGIKIRYSFKTRMRARLIKDDKFY
ncbi:PorT family protein [Myroides sp. M-43]|uniref:outer membrane beta-barrel protein n=1 Tax=Myroides oncorhynchi TaxID=2893756 RepID=UPI001E5EFF3A|nr:outer membrane beta-barrel protein [Myroides oncorhynchi]MCC9044028.1 PorT family protein [Myroides oncorhynchi]